ncbi:MAG: murein biosynthesis integral membrane protein MurJ [Synoicihabitans sp.]
MSRSLKNISIVSLATVISRFLGLARDILVTAIFGASALASAFVTAFTLPNLFRRLLGEGALTAALIPTLNDELAARRREGAFQIVNQVSSWLGLVTAAIVGGAMILLHLLADSSLLSTWSNNPDLVQRWRTAAQLAVILFPYLLFICLAAGFSAALQTLGKFKAPALSPIWLNLAMIGSLAGAVWGLEIPTKSAQMTWLCGGVLVGGFLQMWVPALALKQAGWRPRWDLTLSPAVRSILLLMGPTVVGSAIYLINLAITRLIGLSLNDSAAAILNLATRLVELPIGVFAIAVTTVVFPLISQHAAKADWSAMATAYRKGMRLILAINLPAAVGLLLLAGPIIRVLFERGAFEATDTQHMIPVLGVFALGLPIFAYVNLMLRAFYAQKDTRTPVQAALLSFVLNVSLCLLLMGPFSTVGLALASNIAVLAQAVYLQYRLTAKRPELNFRPLLLDLSKIVVGSIAMGVVVYVGLMVMAGLDQEGWGSALRLVILIPAGAGTFAVSAYVLKLEGRDELRDLLMSKLRKSPESDVSV